MKKTPVKFSSTEKRILESVIMKANRQIKIREHLIRKENSKNKSLREAKNYKSK